MNTTRTIGTCNVHIHKNTYDMGKKMRVSRNYASDIQVITVSNNMYASNYDQQYHLGINIQFT